MNFSQIPFLAVFALPIFSKKRPHIIVIIVDDLGERINSKQRSKLKYTIETKKKTKLKGNTFQVGLMYLGTTPTLWRQELGTTPSMIFLTSTSPLLINCCWCQHWCHLCAGCCAGHYDCFADKEWSWRGTMSTQNALLQGLRFWLDDMLGPWAGEHPFLVSVNNIVQATSRKREGWDTAVHGHFIAKNNKSLRQRGAIERFQPTGLSTKFPLLPEILKV